jgi:hypothetical protein
VYSSPDDDDGRNRRKDTKLVSGLFPRCFSLFLVVSRCFSLFVFVSRCLSLFVFVCLCLSLFLVVSRCSSLFLVVSRCLSLFLVVLRFCFLLLPFASFCFLLLPFASFCYLSSTISHSLIPGCWSLFQQQWVPVGDAPYHWLCVGELCKGKYHNNMCSLNSEIAALGPDSVNNNPPTEIANKELKCCAIQPQDQTLQYRVVANTVLVRSTLYMLGCPWWLYLCRDGSGWLWSCSASCIGMVQGGCYRVGMVHV